MNTASELLMLKGAIVDMPEDKQKEVKGCADKLRATIKEYSDMGLIAMALVGLEVVMEEEKKEERK